MRSLRTLGLPLLAGLLVNAWSSGAALAHVKWFCAYDLAGAPRGLEQVLCPDFEKFVALSIGALILGCYLEYSSAGGVLLHSLNRSTAWIRANIETIFRATAGFFLVSLWNLGGTILTPELKTDLDFIPWIQLGMAACLLWRRTLPVVSVGIVGLFAYAVSKYGAFHLADYPVFLGVAAYLALSGLGRTLWGARPVDVMRWSASITLMWASVEKWAFPYWSFPLLEQKPEIAFGFDAETYMLAAGVVEFVLAFALIWTPLVRRAAAAMLIGIFISAVFAFGKIDAIGHALIIAALLAVLVDDAPAKVRVRHVALAPLAYGAALALFMLVYYEGHRVVFNVI